MRVRCDCRSKLVLRSRMAQAGELCDSGLRRCGVFWASVGGWWPVCGSSPKLWARNLQLVCRDWSKLRSLVWRELRLQKLRPCVYSSSFRAQRQVFGVIWGPIHFTCSWKKVRFLLTDFYLLQVPFHLCIMSATLSVMAYNVAVKCPEI